MPSEDWATQALDHALAAPPTLGSGRLICIDGLAGAGKTTLAASLGDLTGAPVLHADELLAGWGGLPCLGATIEAVLRPLASGRASSWRRWDWLSSQWAETHPLEPTPLLVIDGVGCAASTYDDLITTLVWIEADRDVRLARGLERDGDDMHAHWEQWLDEEAALHVRDRTRERADLVYSTSA
ncbi:4-amino-4-deoxy-L-arabinose transferase [Nocardioides sp.]|uniref:uridine kinase family protein n=1 Tax=Nocardioides sp. TaxID=35761 RepID=UPI002C91F841|nr:4-amino-4-deoxy-L-arabinose transferase [Nocardioides sp.]HXH79358.1 4-amino-4-deoxy-L-arabinose transferase [Nocardioides sp.]